MKLKIAGPGWHGWRRDRDSGLPRILFRIQSSLAGATGHWGYGIAPKWIRRVDLKLNCIGTWTGLPDWAGRSFQVVKRHRSFTRSLPIADARRVDGYDDCSKNHPWHTSGANMKLSMTTQGAQAEPKSTAKFASRRSPGCMCRFEVHWTGRPPARADRPRHGRAEAGPDGCNGKNDCAGGFQDFELINGEVWLATAST